MYPTLFSFNTIFLINNNTNFISALDNINNKIINISLELIIYIIENNNPFIPFNFI